MAIESKNYIISINAVLKGDKIVVSGLQQIEGATKKFSQTVAVGKTQTQDFNDILMKAGARALIVAPIWLAIRSAMMLALATISDMVKANFDLEEGMARIQTVMYGTSAEITAQMTGIERTILDTSVTTRVSIKDLTEAFYFLKTSALSSEEAMAGFVPLVNILTGTNVKAMEASRGLAGMYNTVGKALGDNLTVSEKMTKIADVLTYTYAKQDVEMGELIAGYGKLAPYLVGLNDGFTDIVTTIGFLNTHLLRGARAGTLTGQAIMNMTKASKELAGIFGITFDSNKPMGFLKTLDLIQKKMGDTSQITTAQSDAIARISKTRGGVPIRLLLGNYDEFKATLKDAQDNVEGYAKKIAEIRMGTVTAQMSELQNILAVLTNDFISGVYGVGDFANALKLINETIVAIRPNMQGLGMGIGYIGEQLGVFFATMANMGDKNMLNALGKQIRGFGSFVDEQLRLENEAIAKKKEGEKFAKSDKEGQEFKINSQKEYEETLKSTYDIMKTNGANELDIQKAKVNAFDEAEKKLNNLAQIQRQIIILTKTANMTEKEATKAFDEELIIQEAILTVRESYGSEADYDLAQTQAHNKLLVEQIEYRKKITENLQTVGLDLLKATGVQESVIITMKMKELELNRKAGDDANHIAQMEALRLSRIQAIVSEKLKEKQAQDNLILSYQKADENERARIRRLIELKQMSATEIEKQYDTNAYDAGIIEGNLDKFSEEVQQKITKKFAEKFNLPFEDKTDIVEDAIRDENTYVLENTTALQELTRVIVALSQGSLINSKTSGTPLALNPTTGQYNAPKIEEPYKAPVPLPIGSAYGRTSVGGIVNAGGVGNRTSLSIEANLQVNAYDEELQAQIKKRVKNLIEHDPDLKDILSKKLNIT